VYMRRLNEKSQRLRAGEMITETLKIEWRKQRMSPVTRNFAVSRKLTPHNSLPILRVCQKMPSVAAETRVATCTGEALDPH
jgi:hypothetical protein